jgi:UDP-N-acetylglucosamine 2-epimerase
VIALVAGARPQFVKAAALLPALRARGETLLVHTGQHRDPAMVDVHFAGLGLPDPDVRLDAGEGSRVDRTARMVESLTRLFEERPPARVGVVGDTDTTLAASLAAALAEIPVAHVEAGARSGEPDLPEERNRALVDEMSDLLLCATPAHAANLDGREGVHVVGDVMADALFAREAEIRARVPRRAPYAVLTVHRARTADDPAAVARVLGAAARGGLPVLFPRHPRTKVSAAPAGVEVLAPLPYLDFLGLVAGAACVLTDSGGLQKEAYLLGVPCITLRDATEWGETIEAGWNVLAGTDPDRILAALARPPRGDQRPALYGDGRAAERVAALL